MRRYIPAIMIIALLALSACAPPPTPPTGGIDVTGEYTPPQTFDPNEQISGIRFTSEEEFAAFVQSHQNSNGGSGMARGVEEAMDSAQAESAPSPAKLTSGGADLDYSGTNNQVTNVDEADILKTDGNYIYTVTGTTLFIIDAYPGENAEVIATLDLKQQPQGLFVDGDRLVVLGNFYDNEYFRDFDLRPRYGMTQARIYDITDRSEPELLEDFKFEGSYSQARMVDGQVFVVVQSGLDYRERPLPIVIQNEKISSVPVSDIYYYPVPYSSVQFVTVHTFDTNGADLESKTLTIDNLQTVYMSEDNLYLVGTEWINEWTLRQKLMIEMLESKLPSRDRDLIRRIKATDDDVLSPSEKESKISQVYYEYVNYLSNDEQEDLQEDLDAEVKREMSKYESNEYTVLYKLETYRGTLVVGPTAKLPGRINNQFSLDEHNGVLRIATTLSPQWWGGPVLFRGAVDEVAVMEDAPIPVEADGGIGTTDEKMIAPEPMPPRRTESSNSVFTLDEDLELLDRLDNIAQGETIYATRFMGDRLYMVTFRQVDPFFVIDLSRPTNIEILGKLKIPGFSRYLHPYDEDHVIGIGRDATDTGRQQGLKISLFDVSDVSDPQEVASWVADEQYSQSSAEWEHKAFLFDKEKQLLVIPGYSYNYDYRGGSTESWNGAMVFRITSSSIRLRGIIDHSSGSQYYGTQVERSLYIEDLLYTKSPNLLRINELDDLSSVKKITLESKSSGPYPVY